MGAHGQKSFQTFINPSAAINRDLSWSIAADSPTLSDYFIARLAKAVAIYDFSDIFEANFNAPSIINFSEG